MQLHEVCVEILHVLELAAAVLAHGHDVADEVLRRDDGDLDIRFLGVLDRAGVGVVVGVIDLDERAVGLIDVVDDARERRHEVEIELALEPLLNDLHVQHPEKAAAEAETQRHGRLRLEGERGIVELELFERVAQVGVLAAVLSIDAAVDHRLRGSVARQRLGGGALGVGDRVADTGVLHVFDARGEIAHLTGLQRVRRLVAEGL